MKKNKVLLLFPFILLLFSGCHGFVKVYGHHADSGYIEGPDDDGPILTFVNLLSDGLLTFPSSLLQPILPLPYEKYYFWFSVTNINDTLKEVREKRNEDYMTDIMRSMYIDEFRVVLPSGKIIDLLDKKIDIIYHYNGSEEVTGMLYKEVKNVKPKYIDGVKGLFFDGIKDGDGISIDFYTKIPAYFVESIRLEYTLNIDWENRGKMKTREILIFNKKLKSFFPFTA
jgi:hypothetical protein